MPADMKTIPKNHLGALIAFAVAFILSLIGSYIVASFEASDTTGLVGGISDSGGVNAWWDYAKFGMLLLIVAAAIVAVRAFAPHVLPAGVPWQRSRCHQRSAAATAPLHRSLGSRGR